MSRPLHTNSVRTIQCLAGLVPDLPKLNVREEAKHPVHGSIESVVAQIALHSLFCAQPKTMQI